MNSLFEQGYHGRRNTLTCESTARVSCRSSLLACHRRPELDDILGRIAPACQPPACKIPTWAANYILAEEGPRRYCRASLRHCSFKSDISC